MSVTINIDVMTQYINKQKIVELIDRAIQACSKVACNPKNEEWSDHYLGKAQAYQEMQDFIETLDVKEVVEHDDSDLDIVLSELGVEPDSSFANSLKNAFYRAFDSYKTKD